MVLELRLCWLTICWKLLVRMSQLKFEIWPLPTFSRLMPSSRLVTLVILENHGFESQPNTLLRFHFEIRSPLKRMDATASQKKLQEEVCNVGCQEQLCF